MDAHPADFARRKGDLKDCPSRYFIGHYNPRGNLFCAQAIKPKLVEILDSKPPPDRGDV